MQVITPKERERDDFYATEPKAIDYLLEGGAEINKNVWECCCGQGHLSKRLEELGYNVKSTDLIERGYGVGGVDFLQQTEVFDGDILTNPPYKYATEFCYKALELVNNGNKVFMFVRLQFLEGKSRYELFQKHKPRCVYVSSCRLKCAIGGNFDDMTRSAICYAWIEFQKGYQGPTELRWINSGQNKNQLSLDLQLDGESEV